MYNCYAHGWSSYFLSCPACPQRTITTSGASIEFVVPDHSTSSEYKKLYETLERERKAAEKLVEALERINKGDFLCLCREMSREALQQYRKEGGEG